MRNERAFSNRFSLLLRVSGLLPPVPDDFFRRIEDGSTTVLTFIGLASEIFGETVVEKLRPRGPCTLPRMRERSSAFGATGPDNFPPGIAIEVRGTSTSFGSETHLILSVVTKS